MFWKEWKVEKWKGTGVKGQWLIFIVPAWLVVGRQWKKQ